MSMHSTNNKFVHKVIFDFSVHMKKINTMRAKLLHTMFKTNLCEIVSSSIYQKLLKNKPSYTETCRCVLCESTIEVPFFTLNVNNESFGNDLNKLETSIVQNLAEQGYCHPCKIPSEILSRDFKSHLFVEVVITSFVISITTHFTHDILYSNQL